MKDRFDGTDCVGYEKKKCRKSTAHEENKVLVAAAIIKIKNPHLSTRQISSVSQILHRHKFHAYYVQLVQKLDDEVIYSHAQIGVFMIFFLMSTAFCSKIYF